MVSLLRGGYGITSSEACEILKGQGCLAWQACKAIKEEWGTGYSTAVRQLLAVGYSITDTKLAVISIYSGSVTNIEQNVSNVLKDVHASASDLTTQLSVMTRDQFEQFIRGFNGALSSLVYALSDMGKSAQEVVRLLKDVGRRSVGQIAGAMLSHRDVTEQQVAGLLKDAGYWYDAIADGLWKGLGYNGFVITPELRKIGCTVPQVFYAIKTSFSGVINALKVEGVPLSEIADALKTDARIESARDLMRILYQNYGLETVVGELKRLDYSVKEVGNALEKGASHFSKDAEEVAEILKDVGYRSKDAAKILYVAMEDISADHIGEALTDAYDLSAKKIGGLLEDLDYDLDDVADFLEDAFDLDDDDLVDVLEDAGFDAGDVEDFADELDPSGW